MHFNQPVGNAMSNPHGKGIRSIPNPSKPSTSLHATRDSSPSLNNLFEKGKGILSSIASFSTQFKAPTTLSKDSMAVETMVQDSQTFPANPQQNKKDFSVNCVLMEISAAKAELAQIKNEKKKIDSAIKKGRDGLREKGVSADIIEMRERLLKSKESQLEKLLLRNEFLEKNIKGLEKSIPFIEKMEKREKWFEEIKKLHQSS